MNRLITVNPSQLLQTQVKDYVPTTHRFRSTISYQRPIFSQSTVHEMSLDPRVLFGLWLIKGPMLSKARFEVECENEEVKTFVADLINDFWMNGAVQALRAIEWGFSGSEVLYKLEEETGRIAYKGLKDFQAPNVRVVTKQGVYQGLLIQNYMTTSILPGKSVYLGGPKAFHHVHWRHIHPLYGESRLRASHIPWNEMWSQGGFRDIRRMWFYKNAFSGGIMYHPQGYFRTPEGRVISYNDHAQAIIEQMRTGAVLTLPSDVDKNGNKKWEYVEPKGNSIPQGLFEYEQSLRIEILEGMGIPYEVIEASGNEGFGSSSGREIPQTAFYSILQEELNWLMYDLVDQIARPLVQINAALNRMPYAPFNVLSHSLNANPEEMVYDESEDGDGDGISNEDQGQQSQSGESTQGPQNPGQQEADNRKPRLQVAA